MERAAQAAWDSLGSELEEVPPDPLSQRRATLNGLADMLEGAPAAPAEDQLAAWIIELRQAAYRGRRISVDVAPALRSRTLSVTQGLVELLSKNFGELVA